MSTNPRSHKKTFPLQLDKATWRHVERERAKTHESRSDYLQRKVTFAMHAMRVATSIQSFADFNQSVADFHPVAPHGEKDRTG